MKENISDSHNETTVNSYDGSAMDWSGDYPDYETGSSGDLCGEPSGSGWFQSAPPAREIERVEVSVNVTETITLNNTCNETITSLQYKNITVSRLCGFPAVCSQAAYGACANTSLKACVECSQTGTGILMFLIVLLGLTCVFGNVLVVVVLKKLGLHGSFTKMKFSLAVADFLTGVQLLVVALYNINWSMNVTSTELDRRQLLLLGSPQAIAGGMFLLLTFISSLYHLVFMGAQRLYAIKWPMRYRMQSNRNVVVGLVVVWLLALIASTFPAWFPGELSYCYQHTIFLFYVTQTNVISNDENFTHIIVVMGIMLIIPYIAMSFMSFATIFAIRSKIQKSSEMRSKKNSSSDKSEVKMFVVLALMQIGFTITIIPVVLVNALFYGGILNCNNVSLPFLICFYLSMTNSVVNVIIYSLRDKAFAKAARRLLSSIICCKSWQTSNRTSISRVTESTVT